MEIKNYSISLDIGTNSIGWVVVDNKNNLLKFRNKNMWGVRLFDEGQTAKARRLVRGQRRRYVRRKNRIELLREIMGPLVLQKDEAFFMKMQNSFLQKNLDTDKNEPLLFNEKDFTDNEYYDRYPTIYHLRESLIKDQSKTDIRLVYLAIHHIIKYRGNFISEGKDYDVNNTSEIKNNIEELFNKLNDEFDINVQFIEDKINCIVETLISNKKSRREKQSEINTILIQGDKNNKRQIEEVTKAIIGYKTNLSKLFNNDEIKDESGNDLSVEILDEDLENKIESLAEEEIAFVELLKKVHSYMLLKEILQGKNSLCEAMVAKYKKHEEDLKILKSVMKKYFTKSDYDEMFNVKDIKVNYYNYIKHPKECSKKDLGIAIKKLLDSKKEVLFDSKEYMYIIKEIENDNYLSKQTSTDNASIPFQLNRKELEIIIDNQGKYYPELKDNKEKIISILEFRIPYYIGPLNNFKKDKGFAWVERKEEGKVYPWNFNEIIDVNKSAEKFIMRMTNKCTYLKEEDVIPKTSLIYSKFEVLNELNKIRVNEKLLDIEVKNRILNELFTKCKKVDEKKLINWLFVEKIYNTRELDITGYQKDKEFASSLKSYIDFKRIFGKIDESNKDMIEEIITWITLFEDKRILKDKIETKYTSVTKEQIKQIQVLKYSGWSRLSRKLLDGIYGKDRYGNRVTIIDMLEKTNMNFMQIINDNEFGFDKIIEQNNKKHFDRKIIYKDIDELQGSPAIKKGIWQGVKIVEEIVNIMKHEPENIFLEFARSDEESKRTASRLKRLMKLYEDIEVESSLYNKELIKELKNAKDKELDNQSLYLYFIQNGKCMYTGKRLEINNLSDYEIDHIIPQSFIKDDSIENKALVLKGANQKKSDSLVLEPEIRQDREAFWYNLYKNGLIGAKKYNNLKRSAFNEKDFEGFINRQLVETRQITKHVAMLFKDCYKNTDIVTIKADLTSNFREQFEIYKNRNVNDYHHAQDAYIAAVVGNFIKLRYGKVQSEFIYGEYTKFKKQNNKNSKHGYIISVINKDFIDEETGEVLWEAEKQKQNFIKTLKYRDCIVTKKLEEGSGQFYNINIVRKKPSIIPIRKGLDTAKYGGYEGVNEAYCAAIAYDRKKGKKGKIERVSVIEGVPIHIAKSIKADLNKLKEYFEVEKGLSNVEILKEKILKYQLVDIDGNLCYIASSGEVHNAKQLILDNQSLELIFKINNSKEKNQENISKEINQFYEFFLNKLIEQYKLFDSVTNNLEAYKDKFVNLDYSDKVDFVNECLKLTKANSLCPNLKKYGLSDRMGRKNNFKFDLNRITFIDQSVTGIYESRRKYAGELENCGNNK